MANSDNKGAGPAGAGKPDEKTVDKTAQRGARQESAQPSGDSPKPHGDPLLHVVKDKD
jgi:hypothetical protein